MHETKYEKMAEFGELFYVLGLGHNGLSLMAGFDIPRGPGAYAPRFFSLRAHNGMKNNQKSCF